METKLQREINSVLKEFPMYWDEDTLLKNKLIEDIRSYNEKIIEALLSKELIRSTYSLELKSGAIFKVEDFISMLRFKNYWDNSYTKYTNEIGLTSEGKYLNYNTDVVLDFPHKDSVLEGGMTKEESHKKEVYYHNVIAKEEIDKLLDKKVLVNAKKYNSDGIKNIDKFSENDNLIMKGNNLLALHTLKDKYASKVKLIYIDPPYNTGKDSFKYNDNFNRSTWLTFMKNRLEIAKELLREDGSIFVSIDEKQQAYLQVLMNEIFGEKNLLEVFHIQARYTQKSLNEKDNFQPVMEYVLAYAKNKNIFKPNKPYVDYDISKFKWEIQELSAGEKIELGGKKVTIFKKDEYKISKKTKGDLNGLKDTWASGSVLTGNTSGKFFDKHLSNRKETDGLGTLYKVEGIGEDGLGYRYFTGPKKESSIRGQFYSGVPLDIKSKMNTGEAKKYKPIVNYYDLSGDFGNIRHEGGIPFNSGKKPEKLMKIIIELASNEGDLILDFNLGSASTAATALKLNRSFIGIEQMDYIKDLSLTRLYNVIKDDKTGISKDVKWQGGGSFVYAELYSLNEEYLHRIQACQNAEELEYVIDIMKQSAYLNFKVDLERVTTKNEHFKTLSLKEQKDVLIQVLDMNQLYLNYSEIEDSQYDISDSVKAFNHAFYQKEGDTDE